MITVLKKTIFALAFLAAVISAIFLWPEEKNDRRIKIAGEEFDIPWNVFQAYYAGPKKDGEGPEAGANVGGSSIELLNPTIKEKISGDNVSIRMEYRPKQQVDAAYTELHELVGSLFKREPTDPLAASFEYLSTSENFKSTFTPGPKPYILKCELPSSAKNDGLWVCSALFCSRAQMITENVFLRMRVRSNDACPIAYHYDAIIKKIEGWRVSDSQ